MDWGNGCRVNIEKIITIIDVFLILMTIMVISVVVIEYKLLEWNDRNICLKFLMLFSTLCVSLAIIIMGIQYVKA